MSLLTPQDYRGWWGQVRALTKEFSENIENKSALAQIYSLYESALVFVPSHEKCTIEQQFLAYYNPLANCNTQNCNSLQHKIELLEDESAKLQFSINNLSRQQYPRIKPLSSRFLLFIVFFPVAGFLITRILDSMHIFILMCIVFVISLIWGFIIRPINNAKTVSRQKHASMELQHLRSRYNSIQQELYQARERLEVLSR